MQRTLCVPHSGVCVRISPLIVLLCFPFKKRAMAFNRSKPFQRSGPRREREAQRQVANECDRFRWRRWAANRRATQTQQPGVGTGEGSGGRAVRVGEASHRGRRLARPAPPLWLCSGAGPARAAPGVAGEGRGSEGRPNPRAQGPPAWGGDSRRGRAEAPEARGGAIRRRTMAYVGAGGGSLLPAPRGLRGRAGLRVTS